LCRALAAITLATPSLIEIATAAIADSVRLGSNFQSHHREAVPSHLEVGKKGAENHEENSETPPTYSHCDHVIHPVHRIVGDISCDFRTGQRSFDHRYGLFGLAMMQFASTRLHENMELSESALQWGDASEAFSLQCDHAKTATQQYADQASKLMGLTVQISERSVAPLQDAARETLDRLTQR
jgi:hypothetical protein